MADATCINVGVYRDALTYGAKYPVLALANHPNHPQVKIQGGNGQVGWFPAGCFDLTGRDVAHIDSIAFHDALDHDAAAHDVTITLSDGKQRWCAFTTPAALSSFGELIDGTTTRIHYGMPHLIIVDVLTEQVVLAALQHIERYGQLFVATLPLAGNDDQSQGSQ